MPPPIKLEKIFEIDLDQNGIIDKLYVDMNDDNLSVSIEMNPNSNISAQGEKEKFTLYSKKLSAGISYEPKLFFRAPLTSGHNFLTLPTGSSIDLDNLYSQTKEAVKFSHSMETELSKIDQLRQDLSKNFKTDSFETKIEKFRQFNTALSYVSTLSTAYKYLAPNPKLKEVAEKFYKKADFINSDLYFDGATDEKQQVYGLYGAVKTMWDEASRKQGVDPRIKRMLEIHLARFQKNRADLAQTVEKRSYQLREIKRIQKEISEIKSALLDDTTLPNRGYEIRLDKLQAMRFVDKDAKKDLIKIAQKSKGTLIVPYNATHPDAWTVTPIFLRSCDDEATLKAYHEGLIQYSNDQRKDLLTKFTQKKKELAKAFGYEDVYAYELPVDHIIPSKKELETFWDDYEKDLMKDLTPAALRIKADPKTFLEPYMDNSSERKYEILQKFNPDQDLAPYLGYQDIEKLTLDGIQSDLKIFDPTIEMIPMNSSEIEKDEILKTLYNADPSTIQIFKIIRGQENDELGILVFDPYKRANKNVGGAASISMLIPNGKKLRLITVLANSISKTERGYLTPYYLFSNNNHEWGHTFNSILSGPGFGLIDPTLFGYPESDAAEPIQSRYIEERTYYDRTIPDKLLHYKTRKPMPAELKRIWTDTADLSYGYFYALRILRDFKEVSQTIGEGKIVGGAVIQASLAANYQESAYQYSLGLSYTAKVMKMFKVFAAKGKKEEFDRLIFTHIYQNSVGDSFKERWKRFYEAVKKIDSEAVAKVTL